MAGSVAQCIVCEVPDASPQLQRFGAQDVARDRSDWEWEVSHAIRSHPESVPNLRKTMALIFG